MIYRNLNEKIKMVKSKKKKSSTPCENQSVRHAVTSNSCNPMDCSPPHLLSVEFFRQEYWSGQAFPSSGDLPDSGIEPLSLHCRQILYHLNNQGSPIGLKKWLVNMFDFRQEVQISLFKICTSSESSFLMTPNRLNTIL